MEETGSFGHVYSANRFKRKNPKIYDDSHQNYGAPKIAAELRKSGENIAEKTVGNYMRQMGIKAQWIKPYTQTTIDSDLSQKLKNILNEQFNPEHPDAVWCSDITYIWTYEGFVYLTSIMDLYSRKIISWVLSETLEASHVVKCIEKAKQSRHIENPLIFHCDRGCQYVSEAFRKATEGMIHSYSKKAYPWDNACIESFHALLKREWINRFKIFNYTHAYKLVLNISRRSTIPFVFIVIVDIYLQMNMRKNIKKSENERNKISKLTIT